MQIDYKTSSTQLKNFGVPQGSILAAVFLNLYMVDIIDNITCNFLQYTDAKLHQYCELENLQNCIKKLELDLQTVSDACCFRQYS